MNSTTNTNDMTTAQAIGRLYEMFEVAQAHFATQGLTGEDLHQATSGFLMSRLGINPAH